MYNNAICKIWSYVSPSEHSHAKCNKRVRKIAPTCHLQVCNAVPSTRNSLRIQTHVEWSRWVRARLSMMLSSHVCYDYRHPTGSEQGVCSSGWLSANLIDQPCLSMSRVTDMSFPTKGTMALEVPNYGGFRPLCSQRVRCYALALHKTTALIWGDILHKVILNPRGSLNMANTASISGLEHALKSMGFLLGFTASDLGRRLWKIWLGVSK